MNGIERFKVDFIFGNDKAYVFDKKINRGCIVNLGRSSTDQNFREDFQCIVEALRQNRLMHTGDVAKCFTYPEGTQVAFSGGQA